MLRLILAGWAFLALILVGGALGFLLYSRLLLGVTLENQRGALRLPSSIEGEARATNTVTIHMQGRVDAQVPLKQTLQLPLQGSYAANIALDTQVPLRMRIDYQGIVPVRSHVDIQGTTDLIFNKSFLPKFPIKARLPLQFNLPVALSVPVDTRIRFAYQGPVQLRFNQTLSVPVDTVLRTHMNLDRTVEAPIRARFGLRVHPPATAVALELQKAQMHLSLAGLSLGGGSTEPPRREKTPPIR